MSWDWFWSLHTWTGLLPLSLSKLPRKGPLYMKSKVELPQVPSSLYLGECCVSPSRWWNRALVCWKYDLFCSCVTGKLNCVWDLIIVIWFGVFLFVCFKYGLLYLCPISINLSYLRLVVSLQLCVLPWLNCWQWISFWLHFAEAY